MNRLGNAKNPYQNDNVKKVLAICSAGLLRSPTTAKVLAELYGYNTRAAGINEEYALIPVDDVLIYWADELVFMEEGHFLEFKATYADIDYAMYMLDANKYQILNIPDAYGWNTEELVTLITEAYKP